MASTYRATLVTVLTSHPVTEIEVRMPGLQFVTKANQPDKSVVLAGMNGPKMQLIGAALRFNVVQRIAVDGEHRR